MVEEWFEEPDRYFNIDNDDPFSVLLRTNKMKEKKRQKKAMRTIIFSPPQQPIAIYFSSNSRQKKIIFNSCSTL